MVLQVTDCISGLTLQRAVCLPTYLVQKEEFQFPLALVWNGQQFSLKKELVV